MEDRQIGVLLVDTGHHVDSCRLDIILVNGRARPPKGTAEFVPHRRNLLQWRRRVHGAKIGGDDVQREVEVDVGNSKFTTQTKFNTGQFT